MTRQPHYPFVVVGLVVNQTPISLSYDEPNTTARILSQDGSLDRAAQLQRYY